MASVGKWMKKVRRVITDEGFELIDVSINNHIKWRVTLPAWENARLLVTSGTPSSNRSRVLHRIRRDLRRMASR